MRVLVTGGRSFMDRDFGWATLDRMNAEKQISCIIQGGASGADYIASRWASTRGVAMLEFSAQWIKHGNAAGPIRNQKMIDEGKPDMVVAFKGGRGTADMVRRAEAAGLPVVRPSPPSGPGREAHG